MRIAPLLAVGAAMLAALVDLPAAWLDGYVHRVYPALQTLLTATSNALPFAAFDGVLALAALGMLVLGWTRLRGARGRRIAACGRLAGDLIVCAATAFVLFQLCWGFNYQRPTLLGDRSATPQGAYAQWAQAAARGLNADVDAAHAQPWPTTDEAAELLRPSVDAVLADLGQPVALPPRPKHSLLEPLQRAAGVGGLVNPFGLELIVDSRVPGAQRASYVAHEWAHVAGIAREEDAEYVALIACLQSHDPRVRYAGWIDVFRWLPERDRAAALDAAGIVLSPQVRRDLRMLGAPPSASAPKSTLQQLRADLFDGFLKARGIADGRASYGRVLDLLAATPLDATLQPQLGRTAIAAVEPRPVVLAAATLPEPRRG